MIKISRFVILGLLCSISFFSHAQKRKHINYSIQKLELNAVSVLGMPRIQAEEYTLFQLDVETLKSKLAGITYREGVISGFIGEIDLPFLDGTTKRFTVKRNQTLHPELNAKFPEILTLDAYATDDSGVYGKWDITPKGLHAMIFIPGESTLFIDPFMDGNTSHYIVYRKKDFRTNKLIDCSFVSEEDEQNLTASEIDPKAMFGTCDLRTYRLAVSATGEYTTFHGGTVAGAVAAQATTMNRVNGVYEKDIAITMVIIPNNDLLIFTNAATDPFTNGTPGSMINQNQTVTDNTIGSANYDIGHVFGTNSGGLAGLGVVCTNGQKARGVTGSAAPVGDPFDIDYVAHEIGHQFGGNHTQNNNCNSVSAARREPGSASTIMGYAGICAPNVQNNSDDYFHGYTLQEFSVEVLSNGHQCEVLTPLNNEPPVIVSTNASVSVPISTPFALTATATDTDGDVLTYLWEQMNNQASTQPPVATATGGPNFRSFDPSSSPTRYFPRLSALASNGPFTWEVLPSVARTMNFRLSVRDNHAVGSCNDYTDVTMTFVATAGPFVVSYPSATGISWAAGTTETVTWDIANTDLTPINCQTVRILLSTDGGQTYPTVLSSGTPNDGSQAIVVPNLATTTARIMVISENGTFFDISNNNFTITGCAPILTQVTQNGPSLTAVQTNVTYQWINCETNQPIVGATSQTFQLTQLVGNYAVILTSGNCSDTSACFLINQTSLDELEGVSVMIQPNPVVSDVQVNWEGTSFERIELVDAVGKMILSKSLFSQAGTSISLQDFSEGMYLVRLVGSERTIVRQLIKK